MVREFTYLGYTLQKNGGGTHKGEGKKSSNSNGTGVGNKEIEICKVMDVR